MTAIVVRSDARNLPLADSTVDLIVTSPPYFGLRSYQDGGEHYAGQVGDEATPQEFLDALIACTREWLRVLKPAGSLWVNLGDKYAQAEERSRNGNGNRVAIDGFTGGKPLRGPTVTLGRRDNGVPRKSLIGIPWRYALRCIDDLGLILRAEVIWSKPNGLPESVTDRVRRSHEQWFHFVQQPRYFSAVDEVREPHAPGTAEGYAAGYNSVSTSGGKGRLPGAPKYDGVLAVNPLGKLPGSVWTIPTEPLQVPASLGVDHFAAFPTEWPRRIIQGWSPSGVCVECGQGRRPLSRSDVTGDRGGRQFNPSSGNVGVLGKERIYEITGYACACPTPTAPTRPAVVCDPFGGTGTTALVASTLGRIGVSVDLSHDYCRLARWRTTDRDQIAKAMRVDKPPKQVAGQADLFAGEVA